MVGQGQRRNRGRSGLAGRGQVAPRRQPDQHRERRARRAGRERPQLPARLDAPPRAGDLTLPAIEFSYFDPGAGEYQTVTTDPVVVAVTADAAAASAQPAPLTAAAATTATQPDLRTAQGRPENWAVAEEPVTQQPMYWLLWGVPVALVVGQRGWQAYRNWPR